MKKKIQEILTLNKELKNCDNMIFEKENDILSCIKAVGEKEIKTRQKEAALSLLNLKQKKEELSSKIKELCKSLDTNSFDKKKMSSSLVYECIMLGVNKEDLGVLKCIFKS